MLIVEDGTIVPNSNSYTDIANARTIASTYGLTLPEAEAEAELALIIGQKWILQQESSLQGSRLESAQSISYPRAPVELYGFLLDKNTIPSELIDSQVIAAVQQGISGDILTAGSDDQALATNFKIDGLGTFDYCSNASSSAVSANILLALSLLEPITVTAMSTSSGGLCLHRGC